MQIGHISEAKDLVHYDLHDKHIFHCTAIRCFNSYFELAEMIKGIRIEEENSSFACQTKCPHVIHLPKHRPFFSHSFIESPAAHANFVKPICNRIGLANR